MQKTIIIATATTLGILLLVLGIMQIQSNEKVAREIEMEQVKELKMEKAERSYQACLDYSYDAYDENWNTYCTAQGKGEDCGLPRATSKMLDDLKAEADEDCMTLYKLSLSKI